MAKSSTYEERHARASESFAIFVRGTDPERVYDGLARRQGALGTLAFDVVGHMWARPELSRRDRSLLVISTLAAQARDEELVLHTRIGLRNGLKQTEIEEILLHVASYAGFPAAMASSRRVDEGFTQELGLSKLPDREAAAKKADAERDRDAAEVLRKMTGTQDVGPGDLATMLGEVGVTTGRFAFGDIWSRPELSRRDRSIVVISILVSMGAVANLDFDVRAGLNHGLTRIEIEEIVNHLSLYAGMPRAVDAIRAVRAAFAKIDASR